MGSFRWRLAAFPDRWDIGRQTLRPASWRPPPFSLEPRLDGLQQPPLPLAMAQRTKGWTGEGFSIVVAILSLHLRRPSRITSVPTCFELSGQHGTAGPIGWNGRAWAKIVDGPWSGARMGASSGTRAGTQRSQHGWTASCMAGLAVIKISVCFFLKLVEDSTLLLE